jgi:hypothetical protein
MLKRPFAPLISLVMMMALLTLGACSSWGDIPTPVATPTPGNLPPTALPTTTPVTVPTDVPTTMPAKPPTPIPTTTTSPDAPTINFETTGTIAGIRELLSIDPNGNTEFSTRQTAVTHNTITPQQYADLEAQIRKADFFNLKENYDKGNVSDDRYYKITVQEGGKAKTVTVAETGGEGLTPQPLLDLITMLVNIQKDVR